MKDKAIAYFRLAWNAIKSFWWIIALVLLAICGLGFLLGRKKEDEDGNKIKESMVKNVADKISDAVTDIKVERAIIKEKTNQKKKELEKIREEPDGKKRREQLAVILNNSI